MRLNAHGASAIAVSGSSIGDSSQTACVRGIPARALRLARSMVTHASPKAAETRTAPHVWPKVSNCSASDLLKR